MWLGECQAIRVDALWSGCFVQTLKYPPKNMWFQFKSLRLASVIWPLVGTTTVTSNVFCLRSSGVKRVRLKGAPPLLKAVQSPWIMCDFETALWDVNLRKISGHKNVCDPPCFTAQGVFRSEMGGHICVRGLTWHILIVTAVGFLTRRNNQCSRDSKMSCSIMFNYQWPKNILAQCSSVPKYMKSQANKKKSIQVLNTFIIRSLVD